MYAIANREGHGTVRNDAAAITRWLGELPPGSRIALESTGRYGQTLARLAQGAGLVVYVLNARDVLRFATINGAKHLRLDGKTGSLKVGKEADIIILDGTHLNAFPMNNVPGSVVTMRERSNVETVIVAGKIRKWRGELQDVNLNSLRAQLAATRDYLYGAAGVAQSPFPAK